MVNDWQVIKTKVKSSPALISILSKKSPTQLRIFICSLQSNDNGWVVTAI